LKTELALTCLPLCLRAVPLLTYWRDGNYEVDFVVTTGEKIWGLEVKSGRSGRFSGLERFQRKYPAARTLLIGDTGIPLERFFLEPASVWFR
jgi:uncharacterized protein